MRVLNVALIAAFFVIGSVACSSSEEELQTPGSSTAPSSPQPSAHSTQQDKSYDDLMVEIEHDVPGFAGMLLDPVDNNILLVKTTKPDTDGSVYKAAIVGRFPEMSSKRFEIVNTTYDFAQLSAWYALIDPLYGVPGLVSTDIDEVRNKIVIGVETEADRAPMEQKIAELPIPSDAIEVAIVGPVILL